MSAIPVIQPSFAAGELSPFLYGRVDLGKFHVGARTLRNFFVHPHGGASNRPGTRFVGEVDDSSRRHRLIPFEFRTLPAGQTYVLVFGHRTMQVAMWNGATWGFVKSSPDVLFSLATPYAADDLALLKYVQSADTMTLTHPRYSARRLTRTGHAAWSLTPITFSPSTLAPTGLAASAAGSAAYLVVTAINDATGEESLPADEAGASSGGAGAWTWNPAASATNYNVYKKKGSIFGFVAQVQQTTWTDANIDPDISNTPPGSRTPFGAMPLTSAMVVAGGTGYGAPTGKVIDGDKTVTTVTFGLTGGAISTATLADTTKNASANAYVRITDGSGSGAILQAQFSPLAGSGGAAVYLSGVTVLDGGTGYGSPQIAAYLNGIALPYAFTPTVAAGVITTVAVAGGYYISVDDASLVSMTVTDSAGSGAVIKLNVADESDGGINNPGCSTYFMQRQAYADTTSQPQTLWFTAVGAFGNMNVSTPTRDSDAITRALTGRQVNEIRHLVPVGTSMLVMTSGAEWRCWPGPSSNALTPAACFTLPQTAHGSSHVPPIQAGNDVLFVQEKGSRVRSLRFDALQDQYQSFDMSVLSSHLLYDTAGAHRIVEWAFAAEPHQIVWAVRDDGMLLGFTYMREHDVYAWHRHTTDGLFESVATITEPDGYGGYEDAVYLIVNRTIGAATRRYLERMVSRTFPTIADAWFVDCGLQYDGLNADAGRALSISGASYDAGATVTMTAAGEDFTPFVDDSVPGRSYTLRAGNDAVTVQISAFIDHTQVSAVLAAPAPATLRGAATADWTAWATQVAGLGHLEGKTVAILADGSVVPNQAVSGGAITLDGSYSKVTVGLPYTADLETLNLELATQTGPTAQGRMKKIGQVTVRAKEARGLAVGLNQGALSEVKQRSQETLGTALQPFSGDWQVSVPSEWNRDGRLFVRQSYPLPVTILDLIPEVNVGD
jgi:hypothetical protein